MDGISISRDLHGWHKVQVCPFHSLQHPEKARKLPHAHTNPKVDPGWDFLPNAKQGLLSVSGRGLLA